MVKPFEKVILLRVKTHNKQQIFTELPAFSFVKLNEIVSDYEGPNFSSLSH